MTRWLLDTNVLSELRRLNPNPNVVRFAASKPLERLFVSIVTYAEIRFGIENLADVAHHAALNDWLTHKVRPMFEERTLPVSEDVMFTWRLLVEGGRTAEHICSQADLIIGATALHHGLTVVPRDPRGFRRSGGAGLRSVARDRRRIGTGTISIKFRLVPSLAA